MAQIKKSAENALMKSGKFPQSIEDAYKDEIHFMRDELETKRLDLEVKCQSLQEALEELEESRDRYTDLYDFAPVGYITIDRKGCIQEINLTGASLIGMEMSVLIGMPMCVFVVKTDVKLFLDHLRRCRRTNEKVITELSLKVKSGAPLQVQLLSVPHRSAVNRVLHFETIITDITERKLYEREQVRLDRINLVGEMAAGIGHEIRNPMTAVRGFLQYIGEKNDCSKYKKYFDLMIQELDRANSIISQYISLAKNKAVELKVQNLNTIVEAVFPLIQADSLSSGKDVQMKTEILPCLPLDSREISQLILNLVRNGMEAMEHEGILSIKTFMNGKDVVLSVQDQGKGIDPGVLEKIGTPFFTTKDHGTGLGLAVCYSIAARHNAVINIETSQAGTTFFVRFKR